MADPSEKNLTPPRHENAADDVASMKAELEKLRKENAERAEREKVLEKTLAALKPAERGSESDTGDRRAAAGYSYNPGGLNADTRARIAKTLGWPEQDVDAHWPIFAAFLGEMGAPLVSAIGTLADHVDYTRTRLTHKDYEEIEGDVEQEYQARMRRGQPTSRRELYEVVKARKIPELIERGVQQKLAEEKTRATAAAAAETEGATDGGQGARPGGAAHQTDRELTPAEFSALSLEDKEKYLEGKQF